MGEQIIKTQDEPRWIVAQGLRSTLTIPGETETRARTGTRTDARADKGKGAKGKRIHN